MKSRVTFIFAWYDLWIGVFYDKNKKWIYILPLPMVGIIIKLDPFHNWMQEVKTIAHKWSPEQYPTSSQWCLDFWKHKYYKNGISPQNTWKDYTTMVY